MNIPEKTTRRTALKAGLTTLAATALGTNPLHAAKTLGETRVIFLVGDYFHNGIAQEHHWRRVLGSTGWRLLFAQDSQFVTPEVLADADLFVMTRYATATQDVNVSPGWSPDGIIESWPSPTDFMTNAQENAIVSNVRRGMGLLSIHCSIWNFDRRKYLDLLGVEKPIMHTKVQPAHIQELNQDHPITRGIEPFDIGDDEIFNAEMKEGMYTHLFNTTGEEQKINAIGGWCREESAGRIVSLLPGHTQLPYMTGPYKKIMWRSAHWALRRPLEPIGGGY